MVMMTALRAGVCLSRGVFDQGPTQRRGIVQHWRRWASDFDIVYMRHLKSVELAGDEQLII